MMVLRTPNPRMHARLLAARALARVRFAKDEESFYPSGDGKPMGETSAHVNLIRHTIDTLELHYVDQLNRVLIAGNNFIYFDEGNRDRFVSPDSYIVLGRPNYPPRDSYFVWREENVAPAVVFEFTSKSTRKEDYGTKYHVYERVLRVPEYFLFNPRGRWRPSKLVGFRLDGQRYEPIPREDNGDESRMYCQQMNLYLVARGREVRFYDPVRDRILPTLRKADLRAEQEAQRADTETLRAEQEAQRAEQEAQRAEKAARRAEQEAQRANIETQRANIETQRADVEARLRRELESEINTLRVENARLRGVE